MSSPSQSAVTYLACPYSPPANIAKDSPEGIDIMQRRYNFCTLITAYLQSKGYVIFSPINHSHSIQVHPLNNGYTQNTFDFWVRKQDLHILRTCKDVIVLDYDQWSGAVEQSKGVQAEIDEARLYNIPVRKIQVELYTNYYPGTDNLFLMDVNKHLVGSVIGSIEISTSLRKKYL